MTSHARRKIVSILRKLRSKARRAKKQFKIGRKELQADIRKRLYDYFYNPLPSAEVVEEEEVEETPPPLPPRNPRVRPLPPIPVEVSDEEEIDLIPPPLPPRSNPASFRGRKLEDKPIPPKLPLSYSSSVSAQNVPLNTLLYGPLAQRRAAIEASDDEDGEYTGFGMKEMLKLRRRKRRRNPMAGTAEMKARMAWVRSFKRS